MKYCLNCGKQLIKNQTKYCSPECQNNYQYQEKINQWKNGEFDGSKGENKKQLSKYIKRYLFEKNNNRCEICGWGEINPFTNTLPLEIHHKDGDCTNNQESNLQLLCPNCHSLTQSYRGANSKGQGRDTGYDSRSKHQNFCVDCGIEITVGATRCRSCANKFQHINDEIPISREELKYLIRTKPFTQIGRQFNKSDNAVRRWCDKYGLPRLAKEIKKYSDEEWLTI